MSDFFASGMAWLNSQVREHNGLWVQYRRGTAELRIRATPGASLHESNDADGATISENTYDWLITASELSSMGAPEAGDIIVSDVNGRLEEFVVVSPLGLNRYDRVDQGKAYRIHTTWKGIV